MAAFLPGIVDEAAKEESGALDQLLLGTEPAGGHSSRPILNWRRAVSASPSLSPLSGFVHESGFWLNLCGVGALGEPARLARTGDLHVRGYSRRRGEDRSSQLHRSCARTASSERSQMTAC